MANSGREWRKMAPVALSAVLGLFGFLALFHLLRDVHARDIRAAWDGIGPARFLVAALFTVANYAILTFYDVFALRAVGRPLPYRVAAMASFTSYTISNNLGLAPLTGGSARYRAYSAEGLGPGDVARVVALASLAFWGGLLLVAGGMLAGGNMPSTRLLRALPPHFPVFIGLFFLLILFGTAFWAGAKGRTIAIWRWHLRVPGLRLFLPLVVVGALDLVTVSAVLLALVPGSTIADWPGFFIGYVLAIVAGILSLVPGGVGVFEAVIVATIPEATRPQLVAALLGYRLVYYLLPLLGAAVLVAIEEGMRLRRPTQIIVAGGQAMASAIASALAPVVVSALAFFGGLVLLFSGTLPAVRGRVNILYDALPLPFIEVSHMAASMAGVALLLLAAGLYRRLDGAAVLAQILLVAGSAFSLLKGLDYEEAALMLAIALILHLTRASFYRKTRLTQDVLSPAWLATVSLMVGLSIWFGFFTYRHVDYSTDLWWHFSVHGDASRFLRVSLVLAVLMAGLAITHLLRPARIRPDEDSVAEPPAAAMALSSRTDANLAWTGDKRLLISASGRAFLMYRVQGRSWIVMSDPVGDESEWRTLLWALREKADRAQGRILLYQISAGLLPVAVDLGLQIVKYGEEARVDLGAFALDGPDGKPFRYAIRRAEKEGATFEVVAAADVAALMPELRALSDRWLRAKGHREKGFSVGRFDPSYLGHFDAALVRKEGRIVAFANIWQTEDKAELSVDLMRHDDDAPYGTMDYLFVQLMAWGRGQGFRWFTLGLSPLSGIEARRLSPIWARVGSLLYRHGASLYGFEGLRKYKEKYQPVWEPRFIAGPPGLAFGRALFDLQALIAGAPRSVRPHPGTRAR